MAGPTNKPGSRRRFGRGETRRALYNKMLQVLKARGHTHTQRAPSYIGVCDISGVRHARAFVHDLRKHTRNPNRKVMIGVMTHPVVLDPKLPVPEAVRVGITRTFPKIHEIARPFIDNPHVLNTIHNADLYGPKGPWGAGKAANIQRNLELCVHHGGKNLHAIQLDVNWPRPTALKAFRKKHPKIQLVLQVGKFSLTACGNNPQKVVNRLRKYGNSVDYVLLDMSMGQGKGMSGGTLLPLLRSIKSELPHLGLAVAGGLGPERNRELEQVAREFPDISIDAQGRLKPDFTYRDSRGHLSSVDSASPAKVRKLFRHNLAVLDKT
ncbi:MAG: hypothetical protein ABIH42_11255 [Planctomycetota bacterium]